MAEPDAAALTEAATSPVPLAGLWCPALTPFDQDLAVDAKRFVAHVRWLLERGCHGIGLFGTTGEANSLSVGERIDLLDAVLVAGVPPARLLVGNGCCALTDTVELTTAATERGCKNVLMLPPFYYKDPSEEGVYASFAEVIERVADPELGILLYHFPRLSAVPITHAVIERLLAAYPDSIKGVKDSSGDGAATAATIAAFPDLAIFPGTETLLLPMLEQGGAGCITASANVNPQAIRLVYDAWRSGDQDPAPLQNAITRVRKVLEINPTIATLKAILAREHGDPDWSRPRPPLVPLGVEADAGLGTSLAEAGFVFGG